ncbi:MAG: alpha/beta hydrolase [Actinomycetota bacterium]|nr:alpha/beta hydrolase [Actinomycetota bacterium]
MATSHGQLAAAPGIELAYTVHDSGADGLPVVLLHGLSQQRAFWGPVVRRMRARPVATLDQRGHGESDTPLGSDFSVAACAADVLALLDAVGWSQAVVVGHSWGGSVALAAAAAAPDRVRAAGLVDGGLWSPAALGPRDEVRRALTPPPLGMPQEEFWAMVRGEAPATRLTDEVRAALGPTFVVDDEGLVRSRIGMNRHLAVLDGLLDVDPAVDLDACTAAGTPLWAIVCEPAGQAGDDDAWAGLKRAAVAQAASRPNLLVHRWAGAIHDVPLQWPSLVAGFIDALVGESSADRALGGAA